LVQIVNYLLATVEKEESTSMVRGVLDSGATPRYRRLLVPSRIV